MNKIEFQKKDYRKKFRSLRNCSKSKSKKDVKNNVNIFLEKFLKDNKENGFIAIYWPLKDEIDLTNLKIKYPIALPRCEFNKKLNFYIWDENPLQIDSEGIPAPNSTEPLNYQQISIIFVPCLSVDMNLTRLGYGGGYFDRLRINNHWKDIPCIGVLTSNCVSKNLLPKATWDIPLSGFITDKEILF